MRYRGGGMHLKCGTSQAGVFSVLLLALCVSPLRSQVVPTEQLRIKVLKGEGDVHRPGDKQGTVVEIQVLNEVDLPQADAEVTLTADADGPSVRLDKDAAGLNITRKSDIQGIARIEGIYGNKLKGAVTIKVAASFEGKTATNTINQVNESGPLLNRKRGGILAGVLATTGIVLYEILKPGPPTATINAPTSSTGSPKNVVRGPVTRVGR
jgi:hypothetical protein